MLTNRRHFIPLAMIGAGAGSLVFTLYLSHLLTTEGKFSDAYLIIANSLLIFLLLVVSIVYVDSRRSRISAVSRTTEKTSKILFHLDNIYHTRTGLSSYLAKNQIVEAELAFCIERSSTFLEFLINETCTIFEGYTDAQCAVSIKLLVSDSDSIPVIKTYLRDKKSSLIRRDLYERNGTSPFGDHSPFEDIISGYEGKDFFISNDLRAAAKQESHPYRNGNPHWKRLYNAGVVVPIKEPSILTSENIIGFLCVDSLNATFDKEVCLILARIVANTIFYVISTLSQLEGRRQSQQAISERHNAS